MRLDQWKSVMRDQYISDNIIYDEDTEGVYNDPNSDDLIIDSSELEKENATLFIIGFSMEDKHIKEITHSRIDLAKCGYKITNQVLKMIHYDLISYNEPEPLTPTEEYWIFQCFKGALIFSRNGELHQAYNYDVKSAYPSVLCDEHFSFPVKQGVFKIIDKLPQDYLTYGIYRCCISKSNNELVDRLFRFNNMHYYTHTDIFVARKLGLDISLIQDGQANYLCYSECLANGSKYFRQLCYSLYQLKEQSILAKRLINVIWGSLCSRNKIKRTTINEDIHFQKGENIIDIQHLGDDYKVSYLKTGHYFKYPYARLGVFLTSTMRKKMTEYILPNNEHIYRCHTDSILSDIPLANLPKNDWMGNFKLDKEGKCKIENSVEVFWENFQKAAP
jgi:hypothetical protein